MIHSNQNQVFFTIAKESFFFVAILMFWHALQASSSSLPLASIILMVHSNQPNLVLRRK